MIHSGWDWDVVPACVDEAFDEFSKLAQKALNTQNHANTPVPELEMMMTVAASLSDQGFKDIKNHKERAVDNMCDMCAPSSAYASALLDFVSVYSGGHEAPHVKLIDNVAKGFGCNVSLGESFWDALAKASFQAKTTMFP